MRHTLPALALVLSSVLVPSARAADFGTLWNYSGLLFETAEFDGQPGLDMVVSGASNFELRRAIDGVLEYTFPNGYQLAGFGALALNLDADASSELVMYSIATISPSIMRLGVFDVVSPSAATEGGSPPPPSFGRRWEIIDYDGAILDVQAGDFDGDGQKDLVVLSDFTVRILDSLDGLVRYDWVVGAPYGRQFQSAAVVDLDQDSRDELVVTSTDSRGAFPQVDFIQSNTPLAIGDRPAFETRLLDVRNAPNPFSGPTTITLYAPTGGAASIQVFDAAGRRVRTLTEDRLAPGRHEIVWDGRDDGGRAVRSGVYFYEVEAGGQRATRRMLRVR